MTASSPPPSSRPPGEVTHLLQAIEAGQARSEDLLPVVYQELRRLAAARMQHEAPGHTLQPTALVHEAWLRLAGDDHQSRWDSRGHFFAAAAEAMRRILVENARRKGRIKHGGEARRVELLDADAAFEPDDFAGLLALDEALEEFARIAPEKAELVKLRYFAGLSEPEAAQLLNISRPTASRWWAYARAWLFDRIEGTGSQ
jgi:RNA polymerase sigma factor (TIGR02999 family)